MRKTILLLALAAGASADDVAEAQAIAKAGPDAAREAIPRLIALGKGGALKRFAARDALVVAGPHAVVPLIEGASGDGNLRLLLEGVSFDLGAAVVAPALPLLRSDDPRVRAAAAACLGAAGEGGQAAVKKLIEALYDDDRTVRREAATALGRIGRGAHDAVPALILLANDRERDATRDGLLALGMIVRDAAEKARPKPKLAPEVATAIEKGLAWLARQQTPEGFWARNDSPVAGGGETQRAANEAQTTSLAVLALLEGGSPGRFAAQIRAALRHLSATDGSDDPLGHVPAGFEVSVTAALCAGARVTGEPECRAAAQRGFPGLPARPDLGFRALTFFEAGFAGLPIERNVVEKLKPRSPGETALLGVVEGDAAATDERFSGEPDIGADGGIADPRSTFLGARARWYAGLKSDALVASILKAQRADGSWEPDALGSARTTACMLLALEAASGLAHPLTMPLPDAPQFKAAVVTLKLAAQSKEPEIRTAAEQALAGFR